MIHEVTAGQSGDLGGATIRDISHENTQIIKLLKWAELDGLARMFFKDVWENTSVIGIFYFYF